MSLDKLHPHDRAFFYEPVFTDITNLGTITNSAFIGFAIGSMAYVQFRFQSVITLAAPTITRVDFTLPFPPLKVFVNALNGFGMCSAILSTTSDPQGYGRVFANGTVKLARLQFDATTLGASVISGNFAYAVDF